MENKKKKERDSRTVYLVIGSLLIILITMISIILNKEDNRYTQDKDFVTVTNYLDYEYTEAIVITSYEMYMDKVDGKDLTEKDFNKHNYVLIPVYYLGCHEYNFVPYDYDITDNNIKVYIAYDTKCGLCAPDYLYYLLKVDKSMTSANVEIVPKIIKAAMCKEDVAYKPIIYLYPTETITVNVKLLNSDLINVSYPKYVDGWTVVANPYGNLYDIKTNRNYYGLYWEGNNYSSEMTNEGFVIRGYDTTKFLEEKLELLGLNEREINEFIIYWLPKLEKNKYNYIRFETNESIDKYMPLLITPTPDSVIRVYMVYKPLNEKVNVNEQIINTPDRTGFTVVEWGGSKIN